MLIPVFGRPENAARVAASIRETTTVPHRVVFISTWDDDAENEALEEVEGDILPCLWSRGPGDYAMKINAGFDWTEEPWLFLGADDLRFHRGWAESALLVAEESGCRVIGTNDLGNPSVVAGRHSTHSLVARSYIDEYGTIDEPGKVLHEGYDHQYVDNEFIETAMHRGEFRMSQAAVVEHLHPHWRKARNDATYEIAMRHTREDRALFMSRRRLWKGGRQKSVARLRR